MGEGSSEDTTKQLEGENGILKGESTGSHNMKGLG